MKLYIYLIEAGADFVPSFFTLPLQIWIIFSKNCEKNVLYKVCTYMYR